MTLPTSRAQTSIVPLRVPLRVLLVEDSHVLAERLTETLRALQDISLVAVTNTESATLALLEHQSVDIMILGLHLKQGTGFGVMRKLRSAQHPLTIIVLTNYDLPEYKSAALDLGATHFWTNLTITSNFLSYFARFTKSHPKLLINRSL